MRYPHVLQRKTGLSCWHVPAPWGTIGKRKGPSPGAVLEPFQHK